MKRRKLSQILSAATSSPTFWACFALALIVAPIVFVWIQDMTTYRITLRNDSHSEVQEIEVTYSDESRSNPVIVQLGSLKALEQRTYRTEGREPNLVLRYTWKGKRKSTDGSYATTVAPQYFAIDAQGEARQYRDE